jgi:hypothetical protein
MSPIPRADGEIQKAAAQLVDYTEDAQRVILSELRRPGRQIVLLDGIVKKQDRIPRADLERVLGYKRDVEQRGPRAP